MHGVELYVLPFVSWFIKNEEKCGGEKKALFVGNVNQDFDRQSPVKVIYLDKGLNVSVEDDYESGLDIDELKESVSVVGEMEPEDAEDLGEPLSSTITSQKTMVVVWTPMGMYRILSLQQIL